MVKLIEFYGPASSGKTTMMHAVASKLSMGGNRVETIVEAVRHLNYDIAEMCSTPTGRKRMQIDIATTQMRLIKDAISRHPDYIVADRSMYDFVNYVELYIGTEDPTFVEVYQLFAKVYYEFLRGIESHIVIGLKSVGFVNDGLRYSADYSAEIVQFGSHESKYCDAVIHTTDHDERVLQVMHHLNMSTK